MKSTEELMLGAPPLMTTIWVMEWDLCIQTQQQRSVTLIVMVVLIYGGIGDIFTPICLGFGVLTNTATQRNVSKAE